MLGFVGLMAMDWSVDGITVRIVAPETFPDTAEIVVVPAAIAVAVPALLMVATDCADELQVTDVVRSRVLLSEYVPVAVN